MEKRITSTNNGNVSDTRFDGILADIFINKVHIINKETCNIEVMEIRCLFFQDPDSVMLPALTETEQKKLNENTDPDMVWILAYDSSNPEENYILRATSLKAIRKAILDAVHEREYAKENIFVLVKGITAELCRKRNREAVMLKDLLADGNTVVFKNDIPVLVTRSYDKENSFYNVVRSTGDHDDVKLVMNFASEKSFATTYSDPAHKLCNDDNTSISNKTNGTHFDKYVMVAAEKNTAGEFLFTLKTDGYVFTIEKVERVNDYKKTKAIFDRYFDDKKAILNKLIDYSIGYHAENLLGLIR